MLDRLLICTDLDRTLIPNGTQPESRCALQHFSTLAARPEVSLAYVSGRHRDLIKQAITIHGLPIPDYVIGDVGTTLYQVGAQQAWHHLSAWEDEIAQDWAGLSHAELKAQLHGIPDLRPQGYTKQNKFKLSYYVPLQCDQVALSTLIQKRLTAIGANVRLIWSTDEPQDIGLLDILPKRASKYHAVAALMHLQGFDNSNTIFSGDSGNDLEILVSVIPGVLVANSQPDVQTLARKLAVENGQSEQLYIAQGGFMGMNGNYSAGILEGIAHYYPQTLPWMDFAPKANKT